MANADDDKRQPNQTTPKGAEIPVPTRDAFLRDLQTVAPSAEREPESPAGDDRPAE